MKFFNIFVCIFLMLGAVGAQAEYDQVWCPGGTAPVRVPGGWQCHAANPGESNVVYPNKSKRAGFWGQYECRLRPEYQQDYQTDQDIESEDYADEEPAERPYQRVRNRIRRGPFIASEVYK